MIGRRALGAVLAGCVAWAGCGGEPWPPEEIGAYGLFAGDPRLQMPAEGVLYYELRTPLFSDYAEKFRFVKLPAGATIAYRDDDVLEFPVGTVIAKTFAYRDRRDPNRLRLLETRILERRDEGWVGLPYIWDEEQRRARLSKIGGKIVAEASLPGGKWRAVDYRVPNVNQCKGCHEWRDDEFLPIGPRVAQINQVPAHAAGGGENTLDRWRRIGVLQGGPASGQAPRLAVWDDESSGSLDRRARAWLDINCAHCHNPAGPARTSNLDLRLEQDDPFRLGVMKTPVAAGRGSGDRLYGIVPGDPEGSILPYRLESLDPGVMMPELGRTLVHRESLELMRRWIEQLPQPPSS